MEKRNGLAVVAFIIGLIGAGIGGYLFLEVKSLQNEINNLEDDIKDLEDYVEEGLEEKILPKARIFYDDSTFYITHNAGKRIEFTNTSYDTHNAYNFTSNTYVIPESGYYQINAQYSIHAEAGDDYVIYIVVNNNYYTYMRTSASKTLNNFGVGVNDVVNVNAGDEISIRAFFYATSFETRYFTGGDHFTFFTIAKLA
ncbi:MAG: hypothetical protein ACTSWX_15565 [Promethearchaeota archaeon]